MSRQGEQFVQPVAHLAAHWKIIAGACGVAVAISLIATLLMPRKYTAVTRVFIDPPVGIDPRAPTTVTPIYLDSLRTYELFAASDSLFLQAVERFHLRQNGASVDRLKKSILKVEVLRNTKILDISATLTDPKAAHELSLYLAQETVKMNQKSTLEGDQELREETEKQYAAARARMDAAQRAWDASPDQITGESLRSHISAAEELRDGLTKEQTEIEVMAAVDAAMAGRITAYKQRIAALNEQISNLRKSLATVTARLETLESDLGSARRTFAASETRLQELHMAAGYRGERLRIIDPGIVPEHPSSPDLMLNLVVALIAGAVLSVGALLVTSAGEQEEPPRRKPFSIAAK